MRRILFAWLLLVVAAISSRTASAQSVEVEGAAPRALLAEREAQLETLRAEVARLQNELGIGEPQLHVEARFIEVDVSQIRQESKPDARSLIHLHLKTPGAPGKETIPVVTLDADHVFLKQLGYWQEVNSVDVVGTPTITTPFGKPALIRNGGEIPLLVPSPNGEPKVEHRFEGIQLDLIGHLRHDGQVQLQLRPRHTLFDFTKPVKFGTHEIPYLTVKECDKTVVMRPDQTIVIGGMTRPRSVTTEPAKFLKPAKTEVRQLELLVVVKLTVIRPDEVKAAADLKDRAVR
jgi:hypothetical protein